MVGTCLCCSRSVSLILVSTKISFPLSKHHCLPAPPSSTATVPSASQPEQQLSTITSTESGPPVFSTPFCDNSAQSTTLEFEALITLGNHRHPFLSLIAQERHNPQAKILGCIQSFLELDKIRIKRHCFWCYFKGDRKSFAQGGALSAHLFQCDVTNHPDAFRCSFCGDFIPVGIKFRSLLSKERGTFDDELADELENLIGPHMEACFDKFCDGLESVNTPTISDLHSCKKEPETYVFHVFFFSISCRDPLSYVIRWKTLTSSIILSSTTRVTVHYCPLCLFDPALPWASVGRRVHARSLYVHMKCSDMDSLTYTHHQLYYGFSQHALTSVTSL